MTQEQASIHDVLERARPGSRTTGILPAGTLASGSPFGIRYLVLKGAAPGKTLWINGQVHGTEINGIVAALRFAGQLRPESMRGNVIVTSTANPLALDARHRHAPQDENDLDQCFPGRADGFTTERLAHALFRQIGPWVDLVICMHTQGVQATTRSYTVYKQHPDVAEARLYPAMAAFEPIMACRMRTEPGSGELLGFVAGALDYQLLGVGIPSFMVELGSAQRVQEPEVERAIRGFTTVCQQLGILAGSTQVPAVLKRALRRGHATVAQGGLFLRSRDPGEVVPAGSPMGRVIDLFGQVVEEPVLGRDAWIIAIRVDPVVHTGDRYGHFAYEWDEVRTFG